jgi:outer membrane lipoprotein-sorting protein
MKYLIPFFITSFFSLSVQANNKAYDIAKKVDIANTGFFSETGTMEMILKSSGKEIKRVMESHSLELNEDETHTLLEFKLPKDVRGTKLLTHSFDSKDDSQWIYLSAFRRVKRISSSGKSSSFMGSEFTFEDLRNISVDKFNYKYLGEEKKGKDTYWTYEKIPKEKSGYTKQKVTVSQRFTGVVGVVYYDRSGQELKKATFENFKQFKYKNKLFWRPSKIHMINVQTLKESIIMWKDRSLGTPLGKNLFKKSSLKK